MANIKDILVPDIGDFEGVEVIEVLVSPGDAIKPEDPLVTLESDKAAMDIPSPEAGTVKDIKISVGDKVSQGDLLLTVEQDEQSAATEEQPEQEQKPAETEQEQAPEPEQKPEQETEKEQPAAGRKPIPEPKTPTVNKTPAVAAGPVDEAGFKKAHASPAVRKFARELGADLTRISGSGNKDRILKEDVQAYVKKILTSGGAAAGGLAIEPMPEIDFSQFGEIETRPLTKINKLTGKFLHRNWVSVPHVTQFEEADITDLEKFRKELNEEHQKDGIKVTILSFLVKALVSALREYPRFNSSLDATGENLILKKYIHIGVAVDTPDGLVVPVIRDADRKSLIDVAQELIEVSEKARAKKLSPSDMQGGSMSISSLGGIGGTMFTPIVNAPEVAILGVSRAQMKPVYKDGEFVPRLMLPLSLSYDHRVIDGANGARFSNFLNKVLSDTRRLLL